MPTCRTRRALVMGIGAAGGVALLPGGGGAARPLPCALRTPLDAIAGRLLAHTPEAAVYAGAPAAANGGPLARMMDDYSPAGEAAWRTALRAGEADAARIICTGDAAATADLATARAMLANATRTADIPYGRINAFGFQGHVPYLVTQISGPAVDTANVMQARQSVTSPAAVDAWLTKLDGFPAGFAGVIETLRADEAAGCRPPRILLEGALGVIDAFLAGPAGQHPLVAALHANMAAAGLDLRLRDRATARAALLVERRARPAYAALREQVAAMAPRGREEAGLWAQPRGDAFYAANVRSLGDTPHSPAEVHAIGLSEVARIGGRMHALLAARGLRQGSIGARMAALARDPANLFADDEAGRAAALDQARTLVTRMEARYPRLLPPALIPRRPLEVRRVPLALEDGAPGAYYDPPSLDGTRAGTMWINLRDMAAVPRFRLPTLAYHEGVPGHHLQGSVALGLGERPLLLRLASFNAYQEGWALYAEQLAAELGAYVDDPLGELGRLQDELFRAVRLVVDTGLHHARWSRERAIAYLADITGMAQSRATAEVHRYMAWPGQALGYKLGQLRLLDLRRRMRARLGRRFSLRGFHAIVLGRGAMPLDLLTQRIG